MKRKEGLQKLNFLIKELNDTHNRLQGVRENMQEIEAALLNQQILTIYGHIQSLLPELRKDSVAEIATNKPDTKAEVERKKALLKKHIVPAQTLKNEEEGEEESEEEEFVPDEMPSVAVEETSMNVPIEGPMNMPEEEEEAEEPEERHTHTQTQTLNRPAKTEVSLHEKLGISSEPSLNERFSGLQTKQNLAEKLKLTPIKDLKAAISLNQKVAFINTLFKGGDKDYKTAVSNINSFANYSEAKTYIASELSPKFSWDQNNHLVHEFSELVYRRFL